VYTCRPRLLQLLARHLLLHRVNGVLESGVIRILVHLFPLVVLVHLFLLALVRYIVILLARVLNLCFVKFVNL